MPTYQDAQGNKIVVPVNKCWKAGDGNQYPVNRMTEEQRAELGLFPYVPPVPDPPTLEELRAGMVVTPWQFRKALNASGKRGQVNAILAQADQDTKDGWEVAQQFERLHPMVVSFGQALGLTDTEMDSLFELAATL